MADPDRDKRLLAAHKLIEVMASDDVPAALKKEVRAFLAKSLSNGPKGKATLLTLLKAVVLKNSREFTLEILDLLHAKDKEIRKGALEALRHVQDPRVPDVLARRFSDKSQAHRIRVEAIEALVALDLWSLPSLISTLQCPSAPVRHAAQAALVTLTGYPWGTDFPSWSAWWKINCAQSKSRILRQAISRQAHDFRAQFLRRLDAKDLAQNLAALKENRDEKIRLTALGNIELLGKHQAVSTLLWLMGNDGRTPVAVRTIEVLGSIAAKDDVAAGKALLAQLGSVNGNFALKAAVVRAMGKIREIKGVDFLPPVAALLSDPNSGMRSIAAESLGKMGRNDEVAVKGLIVLLTDKVDDVRRVAAKALGEIKALDAVDRLIVTLLDPDPNVRWCAASSLGLIGHPSAKAPLIKSLGVEKEPRILEMVLSSLVQLKAREALKSILPLIERDTKARLAGTAFDALLAICTPRSGDLLAAAAGLEKAGLLAQASQVYDVLLLRHPKTAAGVREKAADLRVQRGETAKAFPLYLAVLTEKGASTGTLLDRTMKAALAVAEPHQAVQRLLEVATKVPKTEGRCWTALLLHREGLKGKKKALLQKGVKEKLATLTPADRLRLLTPLAHLVVPGSPKGLSAHALLAELLSGPRVELAKDSPPKQWKSARETWLSRINGKVNPPDKGGG